MVCDNDEGQLPFFQQYFSDYEQNQDGNGLILAKESLQCFEIILLLICPISAVCRRKRYTIGTRKVRHIKRRADEKV